MGSMRAFFSMHINLKHVISCIFISGLGSIIGSRKSSRTYRLDLQSEGYYWAHSVWSLFRARSFVFPIFIFIFISCSNGSLSTSNNQILVTVIGALRVILLSNTIMGTLNLEALVCYSQNVYLIMYVLHFIFILFI